MTLLSVTAVFSTACNGSGNRTIALIPRTTGNMFWEAEHAGAVAAARRRGYSIYWNAPPREDDIENQIALIQKVTLRHYGGLILAPDHSLAVLSPVRHALSLGIPVVIVSSPLSLPADSRLSYILNDDEKAGELAAHRLGGLLCGKGSVAIVGVDPAIPELCCGCRLWNAVFK